MESSTPTPGGTRDRAPGVKAALSEGWATLKAHFWILLVVTLIYFAAESVTNVFALDVGPSPGPGPVAGLGLFYGALVMGPLAVGVANVTLRAVRGDDPEIGDVLAGFRTYVNAVGGMLLYVLLVAVGMVLLVIPGLVALVRLSFTPFLITDENLGPRAAIEASWEATRGHGWSLFGLGLVSLLILFGGLLLLLVGVIPASAWVWASLAAYYHQVVDAPAGGPTGSAEASGEPAPS